MKPGDVVFAAGEPTPGCRVIVFANRHQDVWCGAKKDSPPRADIIDWGRPEPFDDKWAGLWVMVKRKSSGKPVYVREADVRKFACVTLLGREPGCPPAQMPVEIYPLPKWGYPLPVEGGR
jgi:hypothetical protein